MNSDALLGLQLFLGGQVVHRALVVFASMFYAQKCRLLELFFFNLSLVELIFESLICSLFLLLSNLHWAGVTLREVDITIFGLSLSLLQHFLLIGFIFQFLQFSSLEADLNHFWLLARFYQFHVSQKVLDSDDATVFSAEYVVICELVRICRTGRGAPSNHGTPHILRLLPRFLIIYYFWKGK